jgi:two-component system NtrC family response regulator
MKDTLLIVEDNEEIRSQLRWSLVADYNIIEAENRTSAMEMFREHRPRVVLLDLGLPPSPAAPTEGFATLEELLQHDRNAKVVVASGQSERRNAMQAIGEGAWDFLNKPVDIDELRVVLRRAFRVSQLERDHEASARKFQEDSFEGMLGSSTEMKEVFRLIQRVASTEASVLILGESGTGKEMVAQAIHRRSTSREGPFVAINCAAIPETLLESELFGHEKGSFTGAVSMRRGRIETAASGTLFLDEIGELPPAIQVKLLRFLQSRQIERVGGRESISISTRVVAATNANLEESITQGRFREDLFYRLAVVTLRLPPLRKRGQDARLVSEALLRRLAPQFDRPELTFDTGALRAIEQHQWPGNIRELDNRIKRAIIMADGKFVTARDLELQAPEAPVETTLRSARERLEREMILQALARHGGKISAAAAELGISRPTMYELIEKLEIRRT